MLSTLFKELLHELFALLIELVLINSILLLMRTKNPLHTVRLSLQELDHLEVYPDGTHLYPQQLVGSQLFTYVGLEA